MNFSSIDYINSKRIKNFIQTYKGYKLKCDPRIMFIINRYIIDTNSQLVSDFGQMLSRHFNLEFNDTDKYVFLLFPDIQQIKTIIAKNAEIIKEKNREPDVTIMLLPRLTESIAAYLMDEELYYPSAEYCLYGKTNKNAKVSNIKIESFDINLIPLDTDICTMISINYIPRLFAFNELTAISEINSVLDSISYNCDGFASITAFGDKSAICAKHLGDDSLSGKTNLILIDRNVDFITPLLTQSGIEGVIAELYGIVYGCTSFIDGSDRRFHTFNSQSDSLYPEFRLLNYREFIDMVNEKRAQVEYSLKQSNEKKDFTKIGGEFRNLSEFFKKMHESLRDYSSIIDNILSETRLNPFRREIHSQELDLIKRSKGGEKARNTIEEKLFLYGADFRYIARIICLEHQLNPTTTDNNRYESLVQRIYANYGLQQIPFLMRLKQMGLLVPDAPKTVTFKALCQEYGLIDDEVKMYDGFVPLTTRIVQKVIKNDIDSMRKSLSARSVSITQLGKLDPSQPVLVGFIGGCTHSELNSLRILAKKNNLQMNFFTTRVYTPSEFMDDIAYGIPGWESVIEAVPLKVLNL